MTIVYVITTGGTIEKVYSERTGKVENIDSRIERHLSLLRLPEYDIRIVPLMNKDSLEMTEPERDLILGTVKGLLLENAPIVITHGTDTMVQTGMHLYHGLPELKVPIVMTGAMTPIGFEGSDGLQNLTESLFAVRLLPAGIHVVIHGDAFPVYRVRKDYFLGRFVWTDDYLM